MPLAENVPAIQAIKEALEPRIIGQEVQGSSCNCGTIHLATARAVAIEPAGTEYPGQETKWYLWLVKMEPNPCEQKGYEPVSPWVCGLYSFIPVSELEELFKKHFGDAAK